MTVEFLLDRIYIQFPSVGETEARALLDQAMIEFSVRTRFLRKTVELTAQADGVTYDLPLDLWRSNG